MIIDATFWVAISFIIFIGVLIYFKIPQKVKNILDQNILNIKDQITEAETLSGSVGEKGSLTFSAPGNKVRSQVVLEEGTADQNPEARRSQPPVSF